MLEKGRRKFHRRIPKPGYLDTKKDRMVHRTFLENARMVHRTLLKNKDDKMQ
jgi:hypothetical protein